MDRSVTLQTDWLPVYTSSFKDSHGVTWSLGYVLYDKLWELLSLVRKGLFSPRAVYDLA